MDLVLALAPAEWVAAAAEAGMAERTRVAVAALHADRGTVDRVGDGGDVHAQVLVAARGSGVRWGASAPLREAAASNTRRCPADLAACIRTGTRGEQWHAWQNPSTPRAVLEDEFHRGTPGAAWSSVWEAWDLIAATVAVTHPELGDAIYRQAGAALRSVLCGTAWFGEDTARSACREYGSSVHPALGTNLSVPPDLLGPLSSERAALAEMLGMSYCAGPHELVACIARLESDERHALAGLGVDQVDLALAVVDPPALASGVTARQRRGGTGLQSLAAAVFMEQALWAWPLVDSLLAPYPGTGGDKRRLALLITGVAPAMMARVVLGAWDGDVLNGRAWFDFVELVRREVGGSPEAFTNFMGFLGDLSAMPDRAGLDPGIGSIVLAAEAAGRIERLSAARR